MRANTQRYRVIYTVTRCRFVFANTSSKGFAVPDISLLVSSDQMRLCSSYLVYYDSYRSRRCWCKASNLSNTQSILSEPEIPPRIPSDTIGIAVRSWNRVLNKFVCDRIEKANFVCIEFCKPEIPIFIEGQVKRCATIRHFPLVPGQILRIKFTDSIAIGLGKPDIGIRIDCYENGSGIPRRLRKILDVTPIQYIIFTNNARSFG